MLASCNIDALKAIYSEREAYVVERRFGNEDGIIIFDQTYIDLLMRAFDTGCMAAMSSDEVKLTDNFVNYEDAIYEDAYVIALDIWLSNLVNEIENKTIGECY